MIGKCNWLRVGLRHRILGAILGSKLQPLEFEVDFFGKFYRGNLSRHIDWHVYFFGCYEHPELELIKEISGLQNSVFLDIGGNVGQHCLFASNLFKTVHTFEPYSNVRELLVQKLEMNGISNVKVHPVGLGNANEFLKFRVPPNSNDGLGSFVQDSICEAEFLELEVRRGDEFLLDKGIEDLAMIKIDIEGFEKYALEGLEQTLNKYRPVVLFEFGTVTRDSFENLTEFESRFPDNYCFRRISGMRNRMLFFSSPGYRLSKFDFDQPGGNFLAIPFEHPLAKNH